MLKEWNQGVGLDHRSRTGRLDSARIAQAIIEEDANIAKKSDIYVLVKIVFKEIWRSPTGTAETPPRWSLSGKLF
ncbi:hypothetical protein MJO28_013715 [Puccinia striiformis f. sp. tritici]|uniref:Uncharacterized protein n=1 Tax=Puccinia striiformis f. sp. tritici TaxID=168172 RepID=A0ACC0DWM5_9BASI|nr:hypothetical protein Pst134EB_026355 [Puccinia striiformis f. sp. tritici]KAI7940063.1 hypothetical protein MJO28_013715 [Puccinia striiformis f. sp. tritici]